MNAKLATNITLILLIGVGGWFLLEAMNFPAAMNQDAIGSDYFPKMLAIALIVLCLADLIKTFFQKEKTKIVIPQFRILVLTMVLTSLFLLSSSLIGFFYIQLFVFTLLLLTYYRWTLPNRKKVLFINASVSLGLTLCIYVIFGMVMDIRF